MAEEGKGHETKLKILACRPTYSGRNTRGDAYTIYEIEAADAQGVTIKHKLRSFQVLPIGQVIEVTVTAFNSEQWGKSYTLHPKNAPKLDSTARINELTGEVESLRSELERAVARIASLEGRVMGAAPEVGGASPEPSTW